MSSHNDLRLHDSKLRALFGHCIALLVVVQLDRESGDVPKLRKSVDPKSKSAYSALQEGSL